MHKINFYQKKERQIECFLYMNTKNMQWFGGSHFTSTLLPLTTGKNHELTPLIQGTLFPTKDASTDNYVIALLQTAWEPWSESWKPAWGSLFTWCKKNLGQACVLLMMEVKSLTFAFGLYMWTEFDRNRWERSWRGDKTAILVRFNPKTDLHMWL